MLECATGRASPNAAGWIQAASPDSDAPRDLTASPLSPLGVGAEHTDLVDKARRVLTGFCAAGCVVYLHAYPGLSEALGAWRPAGTHTCIVDLTALSAAVTRVQPTGCDRCQRDSAGSLSCGYFSAACWRRHEAYFRAVAYVHIACL